jgi:hypothetical protein
MIAWTAASVCARSIFIALMRSRIPIGSSMPINSRA